MEKLFDLQLFNEGGAAGAEGGTGGSEGGAAGSEDSKHTEPTPAPVDPRKVAKYSDEELDAILDRKFAKWKKDDEKKASEAERLGKLSAEEKAAEKLKNLEDRIHEYEQRELRADMTKQARAILQDANIHVSDDLIANLIAEDAEATKASVDSFVSLFNTAVENAVKAKLKSEPPKTGGKAPGLTKEQIMAIPNTKERQKAISENIELFQK